MFSEDNTLLESFIQIGKMNNLVSILFVLGAAICAVSAGNTPLCKSEIDLKCVQKYFAKHGICAPKYHKQNEVKYKGLLPLNLANNGLKVWTTETTLFRFEGDYIKFEKDPVTGNILISIDFTERPLQCDAPNTLFAFQKDEEEPLLIEEYVNATYPGKISVTIPTIKGKIDRWSLKNAKYATFFDKEATLYIGPKVTESQDPVVKKSLGGLFADLPTAWKEIYETKSAYIFLLWLQSNVCDFKSSPVLVKNDMTVINSLKGVTVDESKLSYPCDESDDLTKCTREYVAKKASCSAVEETSKGPIKSHSYPMSTADVYVDSKMSDVTVDGLDAEVTHMHVNEETGNLAIALKFKKINVKAHKFTGVVKAFGVLAVPFDSSTELTYEDVLVTGIVNIKNGLSREAIEKAYVTASTEKPCIAEYGSEITQSDNEIVQKALKKSYDEEKIVTKEFLMREAKHFFIDYVQLNICNLGLRL